MAKTPKGLRASSLNRLKYGCGLDQILPCKKWNCVFAEGCRTDPYVRKHGLPPYGEPCLLEQREFDAHTLWARNLYSHARAWLTDDEFNAITERLALLQLRSRRIYARLTAEGLVKYIPLSNGAVLHREPIASKRYLASVQRERERLLERLDPEPETKAERNRRAERAESRDQQMSVQSASESKRTP